MFAGGNPILPRLPYWANFLPQKDDEGDHEPGKDCPYTSGGYYYAGCPLPYEHVQAGQLLGFNFMLPGSHNMFPRAPKVLHSPFNPDEVQPFESARFERIKKLQDASRNRGQVILMTDAACDNKHVAVKQMPNRWICRNHSEFVLAHPVETELPWQDIGTIRFLNLIGFPSCCDLLGVYRDDDHTYVVTSLASEGDLFTWCETGPSPGPEREAAVRPLARQMLHAVRVLHELGIVHRDLSLENVLLGRDPEGNLCVKIIDFSVAATKRRFRKTLRGKASYQAPELHTDEEYDAFLSDTFSLGVTLYAVLLKDYPWLSTVNGGCKCFDYVKRNGFRAYLEKRTLRNSDGRRVDEFMSEDLRALLEGMLTYDPQERLTLGESCWPADRRSVWEYPWMQGD